VTGALVRKARQVLNDPVLRLWLLRRLIGFEKSPAGFTVGQPPYLDAAQPTTAIGSITDFNIGTFTMPAAPLRVVLPGKIIELKPEDPAALFAATYDDLETLLAAHRFAWLPQAGEGLDTNWVATLWRCWADRFGTKRTGWPWHAYTAAERAINIIDFSRCHGIPESPDRMVELLTAHADTIRAGLEYFGEHYTSNHLSNNGRGLLRIGTALGLAEHAEIGMRIMIAEAGRIFGRSGMLREGSTHYHVLLTRNYTDAWLDADAAGLDQADMLREIAERALAAISGVMLPGGMPLIGDISPDAPPAYFFALTRKAPDNTGWPSCLPVDRQEQAYKLIDRSETVSPHRLADDGWHRFGNGAWQALSYVSPDGWPPMPGHGHHDLGAFELHDGDVPVIVDPGRGSYADTTYESAGMHSGLTIDGIGPTPVHRPYYSNAFRDRVVGPRPEMALTREGRKLSHSGFGRLSGIGNAEREWRFEDRQVEIRDRLVGKGKRRISRRLFVAGTTSITGKIVEIKVAHRHYRLSAEVAATQCAAVRWTAYGESSPGTLVKFDQDIEFPYEGRILIERR
jgi:hypothetical protein